MVTIEDIIKTSNRIYGELYKSNTKMTHDTVQACARFFDMKLTKDKKFKDMVRAVVKVREDIFSSDREAASFILALERLNVAY